MMADVAAAGRTIAWLCDENWNRAIERDPQADRAIAPGVVLRNGEIELTERADPRRDPTLALQAAVAAARSDCRIGRATLSRLRDEVEPWPGDWPVGARTELVALLLEGHRAIRVLEALDQHDLIARFLPEWEPVRSKPQRNAYHRFTVDRHLWEAAANAADLAENVSRPDLLVIGALFHDLGKGYPGDHTEVGMDLVREIAPRLGYDRRDVETLVSMVEWHLLLPDVAMRRDLSDPATIDLVAGLVTSVERLELLHALTEADSKATGPSAWGNWKKELVDELAARTRIVLGGGDASDAKLAAVPRRRDAGGHGGWRGRHLSRRRPDHDRLPRPTRHLRADRRSVVVARAGCVERSCALRRGWHGGLPVPDLVDRRDQLAIAEERSAQGARARTGDRGAPGRTGEDVSSATPDASRHARAARVKFIEGGSSNATVLEVRAVSKIGILHRIAKALSELGLDIRHATVQTIGIEVVDTFYVRTRTGDLVTSTPHRKEIHKALLHAVS